MKALESLPRPSKSDQKVAAESYDALSSLIGQINTEHPEIEIEETGEKIRIPLYALKLLEEVLKVIGQGKMISIVPVAGELTTQAAAEFLGCSRPHLVGLLESGKIAFTKVGKHRRIRFEDLMKFKNEMKANRKQAIIDIMNADEETGLYDS